MSKPLSKNWAEEWLLSKQSVMGHVLMGHVLMLQDGRERQRAEALGSDWGMVARGVLPSISSAESQNPLALRPGRIIGLEGPTGLGLTRVGLSMLAEASNHGPVVIVDVRGWVCPMAAWETGVRPERLAVVRCDDFVKWPSAVAALLEGVKAIYAEVPTGVTETMLRRIGAMARSKDAALILRPLTGSLPSGIAYLRVRAGKVVWSGAHQGHGRLNERRITLELSGKGASGQTQQIEVEDDGTHAVRVVSRLATETARRAAG